MPNLNAIAQRINHIVAQTDNPITQRFANQLVQQRYLAKFEPHFIHTLCQEFNLTPVQIALNALPLAAAYALTPISVFNVGAIAIGLSGTFYFGANQEFTGVTIQQTVHAEQSAIMHAWESGEKGISDMVVNYTPCGHCRQFMNELNTADTLKIHLPHSQNNLLHQYLPDHFGPKDLNIEKVMFDTQFHSLPLQGEKLIDHAIQAAQHSYSPYSHTLAAVALQTEDRIFCGRYAENAAFNPSFLPLQSALNFYRLSGCDQAIKKVVLVEKIGTESLKQMSAMLSEQYLKLDLEYISL